MFLDPLRAPSRRLGAVVAFSGRPLPDDVATLNSVLTSPGPAELWKRSTMVLKSYPIEATRALLHALLASPPTDDVLYWAILTLERKGTLEDVPPLNLVAQNQAVAGHLRQSAATAVQTIQNRSNGP